MYLTKEEVLAQTNGGLQVILDLFPEANECLDQKKKFKLRNEKTASAKLKRHTDGTWVVTDFGGDGKGKNAISLVMELENLDFYGALQWIGAKFGLTGTDGKPAKQYEMESRPATKDEPDGLMTFARRKRFTEAELRVMFADSLMLWIETKHKKGQNPSEDPDKIFAECHQVLDRYGWSALDSYTVTIKGKTHTIFSNPQYPIFLMEEGGFCKLYKPKEKEKQYRFQYYPVGKFPKNHVWGLKQARERYNQLIKDYNNSKETEEAENRGPENAPKLEEILVISGERDAMNAALMGYFPVWQNSETKGRSRGLFKDLKAISKRVINVPDIDQTGLTMGIKAALEHLDLETIILPLDLLEKKDWRGNPCKDLRDFLSQKDVRKKDFEGLVSTSRKCKFWDQVIKTDKQGNKWSEWELNSVNLHFFLWCSGFRKLRNPSVKDGYQYIHTSGHIVREVEAKQIRSFVKGFLEANYADHKLMNRFLRSTILNDNAIEYLMEVSIDFTDCSRYHQTFFFTNEVWIVSKEEIQKIRYADVSRHGLFVWENEVINHRVELTKPYFELVEGENGKEARILNTDCVFFQYLIATCRIHWRKEEAGIIGWTAEERAEYWSKYKHCLDGPGVSQFLSEAEMAEQRRHLANKIFAIGYLLHRYKDPAKPWAVYAMDGKLSEEGQSWGRSGKSLLFKAIRYLLITKTIPGRNKRITENPHIYDGVSEHTDLILVDDCNEFLNYDFFFTSITDTLPVNAKFVREFELSYNQSPKFAFTSNFALRNPDPSLTARLLFVVFSDFFHEKTEDTDYHETRNPKDWLGKNLFDGDFTESDWNSFLNFCAHAVQFYLSVPEKLNPPMSEVTLRTQKAQMGDSFQEWAEVFFSPESGNLDTYLFRPEVLEDYKKSSGKKDIQMPTFTKKLKAFIKYKADTVGGYELNPKELQNAQGRIIQRNPNDNNKATECIYVRTQKALNKSKSFEEQLDQEVEI